ncbi:MAG: fimbria/pilus periplasmic chaperone [Deltaproteobacteria bacterium]|nr:fimbria/pilus periplasmic chaperone [Deltaproteobacteria bacterium]
MNVSISKYLLMGIFCILCCGTSAQAQISVNSAILYFRGNERPIQNVIVFNSSDAPMAIAVDPQVVIDPGLKTERLEPTTDLIATPKRFSVPAKGQRTVRLLLKKPLGQTEQVYRMAFEPKSKGFSKDEEKISSVKTSIKVITTVGLLILADPIPFTPKLEWNRSGDKILFTNSGNANIFLESGQSCIGSDSNCSELPSTRLYPGNTFEVTAPATSVVKFQKRTTRQVESIVVD